MEARFGQWPSFHDAEVLAVRLDSGTQTDGLASVELDLHLFVAEGVQADGRVNYRRHTLVTMRFDDADRIELEGFGPQNVLWDLEMEALSDQPTDKPRVQVSLPSSNGLAGAFNCADIAVIAAQPFVPGEHSVYHRR